MLGETGAEGGGTRTSGVIMGSGGRADGDGVTVAPPGGGGSVPNGGGDAVPNGGGGTVPNGGDDAVPNGGGGTVPNGGGETPAISAHRGGEESTCPGTYEAYQEAVAAGAEYVEFDVRRTSDGRLVAYHQARAPWARAISAVSYPRLCRLTGYDVPLVTDVMRLVAGRAAGHIDLKDARDATAVVGHALEILGPAGFVVTTRDDVAAADIRRRFPAVRLALTIGGDLAETARFTLRAARARGVSRLDRLLACQARWAAVHHRMAATGLLRECRRRGIKTMVWTVNDDPALVRWLAHPDVDVVVTDRPARAAALRERLAG
jgi:glycerophosphoryl diester phosphodiesterase